jgi:hypothetical protein
LAHADGFHELSCRFMTASIGLADASPDKNFISDPFASAANALACYDG